MPQKNSRTVTPNPARGSAFTHGDPAPSNNFVGADGEVQLLDFEYGGFRHALYDVSAWNVLCPLPLPVVDLMKEAFRVELAQHLECARDKQNFERQWALMCAFRALAVVSWIPTAVLQQNHEWAPGWSAREAVTVALQRLHHVTLHFTDLEPLATGARDVLYQLNDAWPETTQTHTSLAGISQ
jgi:thiamine kinase-like enzyme